MRKARYITSAVNIHTCPRDNKPEIAFLGRSNVGKSSLLNRLLERKRLAKTSSTPGRTRKMNYFLVEEKYYFVDLPGYGFAKVPKNVRKEWTKIVGEYLSLRQTLQGAVLIVDIRRQPDPRDLELAEDLVSNSIDTLVVATKYDKLSRSKTGKSIEMLKERFFELGVDTIIPFSAVTGVGKKQVWQWIQTKI